jgi:hypothetical protein
MTVLPQFQGDYYQLQNQQALAQALMSQAMQSRAPQQTVGSGQYQVMPKMSPLTGASQLAEAYLAAKMGQNVASGYRDLGQQQWSAFAGSPQQPTQSPQQAAPQSPDAGGMTGGQSGPGVASSPVPSDGSAPPMAQSAPQGGMGGSPQSSPMQGGATPMNPLGMNPALAYMGYSADPGKYFETQAQAYKPADIVSSIRAAGIDPNSALGHQLAQNALAKSTAPDYVSGRPGGYMLNKTTGAMEQLPQVPEGYTAVRGPDNQWQVVPVQGGTAAMTASSAAKAGGTAQFQTQDVWDPTQNGGQGGFVKQSTANVANAANGVPGFTPFQNAVRNVESNGRAAAVNPASGAAGSMQVTPTGAGSPNPGFGVRPAANNSPAELQRVGADYATAMQQHYGNDTDAAVAYNWGPQNADKWIAAGRPWKMLPDETKAYVGQVATQQQNFAQKPQGAQAGPMASQPPLGQTTAANASQGAPSKLMADSYGSMSTADANYQQSREALTQMIQLANKKGPGGSVIGVLPSQIGTKISPDAAEYQKLHATYVSQQGKALGSGGTDASRANIDESVPTYDKPQSAMISGLNTQLNNLDLSHLKTQYLTPLYQQGNEKAYTQQSAAFDQNIKPAMIPTLQLSGAQQRAAVQAAIKANPSLRPSFEWAYNNGMLK